MLPEERFLTVSDVAETLKVDPRVVRNLLATGELRGIQVGGRGLWRIEAVELEDYIARQYRRSRPDPAVTPPSTPTRPARER